MYWRNGDWHFLSQKNSYIADHIRYLVLIKKSPFENGHPALEPGLIGTCLANSEADAKKLALSFIGLVDDYGIVPVSPFTSAADTGTRSPLNYDRLLDVRDKASPVDAQPAL